MPPREEESQATLPPQPLTPPSVAPAGTPASSATPFISDDIGLAARRIAARQFRVEIENVILRGVKPVQWPDRSLGCLGPSDEPVSGSLPGYLAVVEISGKSFAVHMDAQGRGIVCPEKLGD